MMTAAEIESKSEDQRTERGWLREIAYQLAVLNERARLAIQPAEVRKPLNQRVK